jgi:two-component system nitrogen regulation response regulator GlnG
MSELSEQLSPEEAVEILKSALKPLMNTLARSSDRKLYDLMMSSLEHALVEYALNAEDTQAAAAGLLGISRNTLRKKMSKYRLSRAGFALASNKSLEAKP